MDVDRQLHDVVALAADGNDAHAASKLLDELGPEAVNEVRGRCVERLQSSPPDTRSLLRALDLLDDALDRG